MAPAFAAIFTFSPTHAATPADSGGEPTQLGEMTVTAEREKAQVVDYRESVETAGLKTSAPLLETPQVVTIIPREALELRNAKSAAEAMRYVAGATVDTYGEDPRGYDWVTLRGFDAFNSQYLDGMRLYNYEQPETFGIDHLEILKGPSSVLYGQSTPGGLINSVSKKPLPEAFGDVGMEIGDNRFYEATADFGGPLIKDNTLLYRFAGLFRDNEEDSNGNPVDGNRVFLAPSITWQPSDGTRLTVLASYLNSESTQTQTFVRGVGGGYIAANNRNWDLEENDVYRIGYEFSQRVGPDLTFRQNARFSRYDVLDRYFYFNGSIKPVLLDTTIADYRSDASTFVIDNQIEKKLGGGRVEQTLLGGIDYGYTSVDTDYREGPGYTLDRSNPDLFAPIVPPTTISSDTYQRIHQIGLYAQDQIKIDSKWTAVLSGRHDWVYTTNKERIGGGLSDEQDDSRFTGRAGLIYQAANGLAPYASYSTSFFPNSGTDSSGNAFSPTTGEQYEVGVKYAPEGIRGGVTLSVYQLTQDNVLTTDPVNTAFQQAAGEWRSRGVELEGNIGLTGEIDLIANLTVADMEITRSEDGDEGNTPALTPENTASTWLTYTFRQGPVEGLTLGAGVRYVGTSYADNANSYKNDAATNLDLAARYVRGAWTYSLNWNNVFDRVNYISDGSGYYQTAGSSVRLGVNYHF